MSFHGVDYFGIADLLTEEERLVQASIRRFVDEELLPVIGRHFRDGTFDPSWPRRLGALGALGASLSGYGCAGLGPVAYGLIMQELERGDSGVRSFASVQGALVMYPIHSYGSDEQKDRWLPAMARGEAIGCFGLTEPDFGSNPNGMLTTATRVSGGYKLNGTKRWITNGGVFANLGGTVEPFVLGKNSPGSNQLLLVSGAGSTFLSPSNGTIIGQSSSGARVLISEGGQFQTRTVLLGQNTGALSNQVQISDPGSRWQNTRELQVGSAGSFNQLTIGDGAAVTTSNLVLSALAGASNNLVHVDGGSLSVTGAVRNGSLNIGQSGDALFRLESGLAVVDRLWATNGAFSRFQFLGGTLRVGSLLHSNGLSFNVGTAFLAATLELLPGSTNLFSHGLVIRPRSRLTGQGVIYGSVTNAGGTLSPRWRWRCR